ncbi:MAG TPA: hypothetical protein VI056_08525 [Candidatus Limnocylindria bacterium]
MIAEAGFLFAIAAVSMSLASLAGLVVAFRRSGSWAAYDLYRLRQIVEFGFANVLIALALIPLVPILGAVEAAVRLVAAVAMVVFVAHVVILVRRRHETSPNIGLPFAVVLVDVVVVMLITAAIVLGTVPAWESALLALLARPMLAFLLVLVTLRGDS